MKIRCSVAKFMVPDWGEKVNSGIPRYIGWRAGVNYISNQDCEFGYSRKIASARIYRPSFRENKAKALVFNEGFFLLKLGI